MSIRTNFLPETELARQAFFRAAAARGISLAIADFGGVRTQADTTTILQYRDADYAQYVKEAKSLGQTPMSETAWRPIAAFGQSFHDYGGAFDVSPKGGTLAQVGALAPSIQVPRSDGSGTVGLRWGHSFGDDPHFELALPLSTVKQWWSDWQNKSGHYAPPPDDSDYSGDDSSSGDASASDPSSSDNTNAGDDTSSASGSAAFTALLFAIAIGGGLVLLVRSSGLKIWK